MGFSTKTTSRSWIGTIQEQNMINAGLTEEQYKNPEFLADFMINAWEKSGPGRTAGIAVCISEKGLYHAHIACYGNTTTLRAVSNILFHSHIEPQLAGKKVLKKYLLKEGEFAEKGEQVLCTKGMDAIQDSMGARNDLQEIEAMLADGATPSEIFGSCFRYRRYERMIKEEFLAKRMKDVPAVKENTFNVWICGESGTGKTREYAELCKEHGREMVYMFSDSNNGGLDFYNEKGAPPILFIDEFKGSMPYEMLLRILDVYSDAQIHCRYTNCYCLWEKVYITSVYPPDEAYKLMVSRNERKRDSFEQLKRRLNEVWYKYKEDGEYKTIKIPASDYINYDDLKRRAGQDGFISVEDDSDNPFDKG